MLSQSQVAMEESNPTMISSTNDIEKEMKPNIAPLKCKICNIKLSESVCLTSHALSSEHKALQFKYQAEKSVLGTKNNTKNETIWCDVCMDWFPTSNIEEHNEGKMHLEQKDKIFQNSHHIFEYNHAIEGRLQCVFCNAFGLNDKSKEKNIKMHCNLKDHKILFEARVQIVQPRGRLMKFDEGRLWECQLCWEVSPLSTSIKQHVKSLKHQEVLKKYNEGVESQSSLEEGAIALPDDSVSSNINQNVDEVRLDHVPEETEMTNKQRRLELKRRRRYEIEFCALCNKGVRICSGLDAHVRSEEHLKLLHSSRENDDRRWSIITKHEGMVWCEVCIEWVPEECLDEHNQKESHCDSQLRMMQSANHTFEYNYFSTRKLVCLLCNAFNRNFIVDPQSATYHCSLQLHASLAKSNVNVPQSNGRIIRADESLITNPLWECRTCWVVSSCKEVSLDEHIETRGHWEALRKFEEKNSTFCLGPNVENNTSDLVGDDSQICTQICNEQKIALLEKIRCNLCSADVKIEDCATHGCEEQHVKKLQDMEVKNNRREICKGSMMWCYICAKWFPIINKKDHLKENAHEKYKKIIFSNSRHTFVFTDTFLKEGDRHVLKCIFCSSFGSPNALVKKNEIDVHLNTSFHISLVSARVQILDTIGRMMKIHESSRSDPLWECQICYQVSHTTTSIWDHLASKRHQYIVKSIKVGSASSIALGKPKKTASDEAMQCVEQGGLKPSTSYDMNIGVDDNDRALDCKESETFFDRDLKGPLPSSNQRLPQNSLGDAGASTGVKRRGESNSDAREKKRKKRKKRDRK